MEPARTINTSSSSSSGGGGSSSSSNSNSNNNKNIVNVVEMILTVILIKLQFVEILLIFVVIF